MGVATFSFYASSGVAVVAALLAVGAREPRRALAGLAIVLVAMIVPVLQLHAPLVAGVLLAAGAMVVALLGALLGLAPRSHTAEPPVAAPTFWGLAGAGLLGFVWVLLATGSRQVVELPPTPSAAAHFGEGDATLALLVGDHMVATMIVALLALCCVIAATLAIITGPSGAGPSSAGPSAREP